MNRTFTATIIFPDLKVSMVANPGKIDNPDAQMSAAVSETRAWIRLGLSGLAQVKIYKSGKWIEGCTVRQGRSGVIVVEASS